jgi:YidB-like protein
MANEQGMSPDEMCGHIAKILPQIVDQATPDGMVPQMGAMKDGAMKDGAMKDGAMKDGAMKGKDAMNSGRDAMKNMAKK